MQAVGQPSQSALLGHNTVELPIAFSADAIAFPGDAGAMTIPRN